MLSSKFPRWRLFVALFASLAFVLLVSTAESHHHKSPIEESACILCGTLPNKITTDFVGPTAPKFVALSSYLIFFSAFLNSGTMQPVIVPRSRGPPRNFV